MEHDAHIGKTRDDEADIFLRRALNAIAEQARAAKTAADEAMSHAQQLREISDRLAEKERMIRTALEGNLGGNIPAPRLESEATEPGDSVQVAPPTVRVRQHEDRRKAIVAYLADNAPSRNGEIEEYLLDQGFDLGDRQAAHAKVYSDLKALERSKRVVKVSYGNWDIVRGEAVEGIDEA